MRSFNRLDQEREQAGITQKDLCAAASIDPSTYCRWKSEVQQPNTRTLSRADKALDTLLEETREAAE